MKESFTWFQAVYLLFLIYFRFHQLQIPSGQGDFALALQRKINIVVGICFILETNRFMGTNCLISDKDCLCNLPLTFLPESTQICLLLSVHSKSKINAVTFHWTQSNYSMSSFCFTIISTFRHFYYNNNEDSFVVFASHMSSRYPKTAPQRNYNSMSYLALTPLASDNTRIILRIVCIRGISHANFDIPPSNFPSSYHSWVTALFQFSPRSRLPKPLLMQN